VSDSQQYTFLAGKACQGETLWLFGTDRKLQRKLNVFNNAPGALFATIHFLFNL
jgi:hypothetical protein